MNFAPYTDHDPTSEDLKAEAEAGMENKEVFTEYFLNASTHDLSIILDDWLGEKYLLELRTKGAVVKILLTPEQKELLLSQRTGKELKEMSDARDKV